MGLPIPEDDIGIPEPVPVSIVQEANGEDEGDEEEQQSPSKP